MKHISQKLIRDPFIWLIALVIAVPAGFVIYGVRNQNRPQPAVNGSAQTADTQSNDSQDTSSGAEAPKPQPITQAEQGGAAGQPELAPAKPLSPVASSGPACDQAAKQAAEATRNSQLAAENSYHEDRKNKLRLVSLLTNRYWDEEMARHQAVVGQIESNYQSAIVAAGC